MVRLHLPKSFRKKVYNLFIEKGESVENDHIAFRTFDDPRVNIDVLARVFFVEAGYVYKGDYHFESKHLYAKHFEMEGQPRVFISQLKSADFSLYLQETVKKNSSIRFLKKTTSI